jgi:hypothetical protein
MAMQTYAAPRAAASRPARDSMANSDITTLMKKYDETQTFSIYLQHYIAVVCL